MSSKLSSNSSIQRLIQGKYKIVQKIEKSKFGYDIYVVEKVDVESSKKQTGFKERYIAKVEELAFKQKQTNKGKTLYRQKNSRNLVLQQQMQILKDIERKIDRIGFPKVYEILEDTLNKILITDIRSMNSYYLLPCLSKSLNKFQYTKFCLHMIYDLFDRIESIHRAKYLHRNLRPEIINFKKASNGKDVLLISDFSNVIKYNKFNYKNKTYHNQYKWGVQRMSGNEFASVWQHARIAPSRRDDLESCCYLAIYYLRGCKLPWSNTKVQQSAKKDQEVFEEKLRIEFSDMFEQERQEDQTFFHNLISTVFDGISSKSEAKKDGSSQKIPKQIKQILLYIRNLQFQEEPDYNLIRKKLKIAMNRFQVIETEPYNIPIKQDELYPKGY